MSGILQNLSFRDRLISLSTMSSRAIHAVAGVGIPILPGAHNTASQFVLGQRCCSAIPLSANPTEHQGTYQMP